jgi:hypothetical protein
MMAAVLCGCKDGRIDTLEKRVSELETKVKSLQENVKANSDATAQKQTDFRNCVSMADDDYMAALRANGAKTGAGSYSVDLRVEQTIERQKQSKLEECKLLYK